MDVSVAPTEGIRIPVLLIEDNTGISDLLQSILKQKGCQCHVERSAHSVLEVAKRIKPALVICDIKLLGEMSGLDVARSIRADLDVAHMPLLALSGHNSAHDRQRALDAGFDMFFSKPFLFIEFTRVIDHYIKAYLDAFHS